MSEDGKFLSIDQLEEKFNISKNIMKGVGVIRVQNLFFTTFSFM
jgi:hypothetical protein